MTQRMACVIRALLRGRGIATNLTDGSAGHFNYSHSDTLK